MNILKATGNYVMNFLISIDQLGNSLLGGDPDESISSRLGRIKQKHGGRIPWRRPISKATEKFLDTLDKHHSVDAIEKDEGGRGIVDKPEDL